MANLKHLKNRIRSVKSTQQITKAMKMVAAAKLRRAQDAAISAREYTHNLERMTQDLARVMADSASAPELLRGRDQDSRKVEIVIFTADRGLCGSFNSSVVRSVRAKILELERGGFSVSLNFVGRKGLDVLKRQYGHLLRKNRLGFARGLTFTKVEQEVGQELIRAFQEERFDVCFLVFNTFKSAMNQTLTWKQVIPALPPPAEETPISKDGGTPRPGVLYEPSEEELLNELLPKFVTSQIFQAILESEASEHGARMTAMDSAVKNASEMIRKLTIKYNRTRQAGITTELMEIIGGAEALKG